MLPTAEPVEPDKAQPKWTVQTVAPWLVGLFGVGASLVGLWLILGGVQTAMLRRGALNASEALQHELEQLVASTRNVPRLLLSRKVAGPIATGIFRPAIIVPAQLATEVTPSRLALVLAHEWAHVRNRDLWLLGLGRTLLLALFAHPLFWLLQRRLRHDQEAVADAEVVDRANRADYAKELVNWAQLIHGHPAIYAAALGIWERPSSLTKRVIMILDETRRIHARCSRRWRFGALALAGLLTISVSLLTLQPASSAPPKKPDSPTTSDVADKWVELADDSTANESKAKGEPLWGTVVDTEDNPIEGVLVTPWVYHLDKERISNGAVGLNNKAVRTDKNGIFRMRLDKDARANLSMVSKKLASTAHAIGTLRGDLGRFVLLKGLVLHGRVVGVDGKPLAGVCVQANSSEVETADHEPAADQPPLPEPEKAASLRPQFSLEVTTGDDGRFTMPPLPYGRYNIHFFGTPLAPNNKDTWRRRPLPAALLSQDLTLDETMDSQEWEVRAVPHVSINVTNVDSSGKPFDGARYWFVGTMKGQRGGYTTMGTAGADGKASIKLPKNIKQASLSFGPTGAQDIVRWRHEGDSSLNSGRTANLGNVEHDVNLVVVHYKSPKLIVRVLGDNGKNKINKLKSFKPTVVYSDPILSQPQPFQVTWKGGSTFFPMPVRDDGTCHSAYLIPNEPFTLKIEAPGYKSHTQKMTLAEGAVEEIIVPLISIENSVLVRKGPASSGTFRVPQKTEQKAPVRGRAHHETDEKKAPVRARSHQKTDREGPVRTRTHRKTEERAPMRTSMQPTNVAENVIYQDKVIDAETRKPIPNATVAMIIYNVSKLDEPKPIDEITQRADASGNYKFTLAPAQFTDKNLVFHIRASHPDYATGNTTSRPLHTLIHHPQQPASVYSPVSLWPGEKITGTVVGPDDKPLKDVAVSIMSQIGKPDSMPGFSISNANTDANGRFEGTVVKDGNTQIILEAKDFPRVSRRLPCKYGDLGKFILQKGILLSGRVVDVDGKPLSGVSVQATPESGGGLGMGGGVRTSNSRGKAKSKKKKQDATDDTPSVYSNFTITINNNDLPVTDREGRFTLPPLIPGKYHIGAQQGPPLNRSRKTRPASLSAVFLDQEVTLVKGKTPEPIELRAVEHVKLTITWLDHAGFSFVDANSIAWVFGKVTGRPMRFRLSGRADDKGKLILLAPKGLQNAQLGIYSGQDNINRVQLSPDKPFHNGYPSCENCPLGTLDHDMPEITVISSPGAKVLVKAIDKNGKQIKRAKAKLRYPDSILEIDPRFTGNPKYAAAYKKQRKRAGDVHFGSLPDGRLRNYQPVLPNVEFTFTINAPGYQTRSEKMTLTEGTTKEITWQLDKSGQE